MTIRLFLFDLDGTLVDTAPDLALAVNMVRTARGIAPLPEEELRPYASRGAPGLLGKDAYNEKLSAARAESVKTYLVSKGVDANLIQTEGRGEADPVVDCPNPSAKGQVKNFRELVQCLAPNRRAVVEVVGTRQ